MRNPFARVVTSWGFYAVLMAVAALINGAGYAFNLWHDRTAFDEIVHFYTSFALVAAAGRFAYHDRSPSFWALVILGIAIGVAWEIFEWMIGIIGPRHDTIVDLLMDTLGAALAAALLQWVKKYSLKRSRD